MQRLQHPNYKIEQMVGPLVVGENDPPRQTEVQVVCSALEVGSSAGAGQVCLQGEQWKLI